MKHIYRTFIFRVQNISRSVKRTLRNIVKYITYKLVSVSDDYLRASKADDLCNFMWDFEQYLRGQNKYADEPDDIYKVYEKWWEMKNDNDINLDRIYR